MGRLQDRLKRFVAQRAFADGDRVTIDLPRDYDLESLLVIVTGTAAITTNFTTIRAEAPAQVVKFASLKANGTDMLDGLPGVVAHRLGVFRRGQLPPVTAPADKTVGNRAFSFAFVLDRATLDGLRPKDTNFPTRGLHTFQLELQMGNCADLFTGAGVGTITGGQVKVCAIQCDEQVGSDNKISLPRAVVKRSHVDVPFVASNTNYQHRLNTGNTLRGLILRATDAGEVSDAIINNVKIMVGNEVAIDMPYSALRAENQMALGITTVPAGYVFVDFMNAGGPYGKIADCLDLRKGQEVYAYLDVTGGANVSIGITQLEFLGYNPKYWGITV